jgi:branched-chain amino acid transport system ATP-binding protein
MTVLQTRGLGRAFGALRAVADVSLTVGAGELRAIIGPNGAGKTTLFHLVSGLLAPTAGQIFFRGEEVSSLAAPARCRLGISRTFQISSIFPELSVLENVPGGGERAGGGRGGAPAGHRPAGPREPGLP